MKEAMFCDAAEQTPRIIKDLSTIYVSLAMRQSLALPGFVGNIFRLLSTLISFLGSSLFILAFHILIGWDIITKSFI